MTQSSLSFPIWKVQKFHLHKFRIPLSWYECFNRIKDISLVVTLKIPRVILYHIYIQNSRENSSLSTVSALYQLYQPREGTVANKFHVARVTLSIVGEVSTRIAQDSQQMYGNEPLPAYYYAITANFPNRLPRFPSANASSNSNESLRNTHARKLRGLRFFTIYFRWRAVYIINFSVQLTR